MAYLGGVSEATIVMAIVRGPLEQVLVCTSGDQVVSFRATVCFVPWREMFRAKRARDLPDRLAPVFERSTCSAGNFQDLELIARNATWRDWRQKKVPRIEYVQLSARKLKSIRKSIFSPNCFYFNMNYQHQIGAFLFKLRWKKVARQVEREADLTNAIGNH